MWHLTALVFGCSGQHAVRKISRLTGRRELGPWNCLLPLHSSVMVNFYGDKGLVIHEVEWLL